MSDHRGFFARSLARLVVGMGGLLAVSAAAVLTGATAIAPIFTATGAIL